MRNALTVCGILLLFLGSCYSFKGISIPADTSSYYVSVFTVRASGAPADIGQVFSQELIDKIRNESRLSLQETDPDITFEGEVVKYEVTAINPEPNAQVANNRLTIDVKVQYTPKRENEGWNQTFTYFVDFPANRTLFEVQDQIIDEAFAQITEDIFNKAFTDW